MFETKQLPLFCISALFRIQLISPFTHKCQNIDRNYLDWPKLLQYQLFTKFEWNALIICGDPFIEMKRIFILFDVSKYGMWCLRDINRQSKYSPRQYLVFILQPLYIFLCLPYCIEPFSN